MDDLCHFEDTPVLPSTRNHQHYRLYSNEEAKLDLHTGLQEFNVLNCIRPSTSDPWKPILRLTTTKGPQLHSSKYKRPIEAHLKIDHYQWTSATTKERFVVFYLVII